ncbi:MAG TPA: DUF4846 domain-containing protein, partial [Labilithrix sp.]|nr:DUF4846 domain-containing protein [Labilithrix sp.]
MRSRVALAVVLVTSACGRPQATESSVRTAPSLPDSATTTTGSTTAAATTGSTTAAATSADAPTSAAAAATSTTTRSAPPVVYPWRPTSTDRLDVRFSPPQGFTRDDAPAGSFAAFLRTLPLLPPDALVVDYRGAPLYDDGRHANIAAVVDIDVGRADLQQCADSVLRLHAEWRYTLG